MIQNSKGGPHLTPIINQLYGRIRLSNQNYSIKMLIIKSLKNILRNHNLKFEFLNRPQLGKSHA